MSEIRKRIILLMSKIDELANTNITLTRRDIENHLRNNGLNVNRSTLYKDIEIINRYSKYKLDYIEEEHKYTIKSNSFNAGILTNEEILVITDAITSAKSLNHDQTKEILEKIKKGAANKVRINNRIKLGDNEIYEKIKLMKEAIKSNKKILFDYYKLSGDKNLSIDKGGCLVSPYSVVWYKDFHYLIGNYEKEKISHYRIDRIKNIKGTKEVRKSINKITGKYDDFNVSEYISKHIGGLSSGRINDISFKVNKRYISKIIDELGTDIIINDKDDHFIVHTKAIINKELKSWILSYGNDIEVIYPKTLIEEIKNNIDEMQYKYQENKI